MDIHQPLTLLGGLSPAQFMRSYWQKKPLLVRGAMPDLAPLLSRPELVRLAAQDGVESRLIVKSGESWRMKNGPFAARTLPSISRPGWTLLVQGVDGLDRRVNELLQQFRFVPDARLDDLMISLASTGGGVGPHFDSYDVFLLQASGRRRWMIGQQKDLTLQSGVPLKILQNFEPEEEYFLNAGDMLYLPPRYAHDGIAVAMSGADGKSIDCMTYSIGFKAPVLAELAAEVLHKLAEFSEDADTLPKSSQKRYADKMQTATPAPAELPSALVSFANAAVHRVLSDSLAVACALGEIMTSPKAKVWFDEPLTTWSGTGGQGVLLDIKTRMMYDADHIFINGESYLAKGADAKLMHKLANERGLSPPALARASTGATDLLADWHAAGWIHLFQKGEINGD